MVITLFLTPILGNGITALHRDLLSVFFPENKNVLYQEIDSKLKNELASQRGVTTEKINNAQTATYSFTSIMVIKK